MDYSTLKLIHVACVAASGSGFLLRAALGTFRPGSLPRRGLLHVLPHLVDTALLASAVGMVWIGGGVHLRSAWLQTKIVLLVCYVAFGARALSTQRQGPDRAVSTALAVTAFAAITLSAITKSVLGITGT